MRQLVLERGPEVRRHVLTVTVAAIPVFFLRVGSDPFNVPKLALLIVALSVVVAVRAIELLQGARIEHMQRLAWPALVIGLPVTISWVYADYQYWSVLGLFARFQGLVPYLLVIILGLAVADSFAGRIRDLAWAMVWSGAIIGSYALIQILGLDPFEWRLGLLRTNHALSTLGNPNFTGGMLGMVLPVAIGLWFHEPDRRTLLMKLLPLIILGWVLAQSEGGWAAGVAGCAVVLGVVYSDRWRHARTAAVLVILGVVIAILATVVVTIVRPGTNLPFTAEERGQWWVAAAKMGMDSPIVGHGPNTFAVDGIQYRTQEDARIQGFDYTDDPHSVPMSLFAGWGLLGLVGYVTLIGWVLLRARNSLDLIGWVFFAVTIAYFVQSLVSIDELSLRASLWAALGGLAVADLPAGSDSATAVNRNQKGRKRGRAWKTEPLQRVPAVIAVVVLALLSIASSVALVAADARFQHGIELFQAGAADEAAASMSAALRLRDEYRYRHLFGFNLGNSAIRTADRDRLDEMREQFEYTAMFPDVPAIRDEGRLLHEFDSDDVALNKESLEVYQRAIRLDPHNLLLRVEATVVAAAAEEYERALSLGEPVIDELPNTLAIETLDALIGAAESLGDDELHLSFIERQIQIDPAVASYRQEAAEVALRLGEDEYVVELTEPVVTYDDPARMWGLRALALARLGRVQEAREAIAQALNVDPDEKYARRARAVVRTRE